MITKASLEGFIGVLLTIILIIMGLRLLLRFLAPYMMRYFIKKVEQKFGEQFQQSQNQHQNPFKQQSEGKQTIDTNNAQSQNPQSKKKVGEYIDFEEVD
ncbi:MAG: DUF4834 family protein [Capnocytophaga sp.]|nr:DUF4834 family protein [Capnocytophaga sp.]